MEEGDDPFEKLPDEVYQLIFHAVGDCKSLIRCMAVSKAFREHSERVSALSIVCPGQFTSYVDKLHRILEMVKSFHSLETLTVRIGQPKDEPPAWARCMRYAEIGSSVEKFIFMAAKTGEFSDLDLDLRGLPVTRKEKKESSSESETDVRSRTHSAQPVAAETQAAEQSSQSWLKVDGASSSRSAEDGTSQRLFPDFNLRQVVAPSNDVLKRMVPVIVFAIVQGLDEFRDSIPEFICKFEKLRTLLLVDMLESVTLLLREHQIQQIRTQEQYKAKEDGSPVTEAGEQAGGAVEDEVADNERAEMSRHDGSRPNEQQNNEEPTSSSGGRKGKDLDSGEDAGERKQKGKEIDVASEAGESSSGVSSLKNEGDEEADEVTSPLTTDHANVAPRSGTSVQGFSMPSDGTTGNKTDERLYSDEADGAETWRNCSGVYIHGPGDASREEHTSSPPYRRALRNRESRSMRFGVRRRDRSVDWLDESVRRRHESRFYKGLSFRRREESTAIRAWRLGKRTHGEADDGSYNAQSILESSFPPSSSGSNDLNGDGSSGNRVEQEAAAGSGETSSRSASLDPLGDCTVSPRPLEERQFIFNQQTSEAQTQQYTELRPRARNREGWRDAWRETWSERLGRRARELRREMQSQEMERENARRERLRENVRRRQMEIEREALRLDITFWRAEEVSTRNNYRLSDVSMCIATRSSKPLSVCELESLSSSAIAGPLLVATIALVNEQASFHNL